MTSYVKSQKEKGALLYKIFSLPLTRFYLEISLCFWPLCKQSPKRSCLYLGRYKHFLLPSLPFSLPFCMHHLKISFCKVLPNTYLYLWLNPFISTFGVPYNPRYLKRASYTDMTFGISSLHNHLYVYRILKYKYRAESIRMGKKKRLNFYTSRPYV